jgi:hypothetical protein
MRTFLSVLLASLFIVVAVAAAPAAAQDIIPSVRERISVNITPERREMPVRVQVGINFFLPGPSGEGGEADALRVRARRTVYEMAGNECRLVENVLAKSCRLEAINVNINRQHSTGQVEGVMVNGNFTLQIVLK